MGDHVFQAVIGVVSVMDERAADPSPEALATIVAVAREWFKQAPGRTVSPQKAAGKLWVDLARATDAFAREAVEKERQRVAAILDLNGQGHARHNLEGALIDLDTQDADPVCRKTIRRVIDQLARIEFGDKP